MTRQLLVFREKELAVLCALIQRHRFVFQIPGNPQRMHDRFFSAQQTENYRQLFTPSCSLRAFSRWSNSAWCIVLLFSITIVGRGIKSREECSIVHICVFTFSH